MRETVHIDKSRVSYLKAKIEKLNKKARKLGCREMVLNIGTEETVTYVLRNGRTVTELSENDVPVIVNVSVEATLDYEIPIIDGWELICTFDIMPVPEKNEHVVFTSKVPDKTLPADYLNKTEIHCDHCGINRFRNHSILLRNLESGEYKEVGSTCVKDFFGHNPKGALFMAQFKFDKVLSELDEYCNNQGYRMYAAYPITTYLEMAAACIRKYGWVSKGTAWDDETKTSTAVNVSIEFDLLRKNKEPLVPDEKDKELAKATIEYFTNLDPEDNDYLTNCVKVVKLGYVPDRFEGVACSTIVTYKRTLNVEKPDTPASEYVGNIGERINLRAECVYNMPLETMYGMSELYIFVTPAGEKVKTFYSGSKWSCDTGETYHLTGTVKKHEEYRNEKTTILTRVSVVS